MRLPAIDLFSGAGGLSLGLAEAGLSVKAAVEIDDKATKTYRENLGEIVLNRDIREVSGEELLKFANIKKDEIFLLAGCPPCQGFSSMGLRLESDERNQLAFEFVRLIKETNPAFIIMENVPGMSRGIGKEIFKKVIDELSDKYELHYEILDSADYGVPQHRKRLVMHGINIDIKNKYFPDDFILDKPKQTHSDFENASIKNLKEWLTVDVIKDLPEIEVGQSNDTVKNHRCRNLSELNIERIKNTPINGGSRSDWPDRLKLKCHSGKVGYGDVYGRMDYNSQAPTITAGCLSYSKGRFGHPTQNRPISAREAARLQTFPDEYEFFGSLDSIGRQIGNAVPPNLAKASGMYFLELVKKYILKN